MGSSGSVLEKKRLNMHLHFFALFLLLVLTVNGAPKPDPKSSPKAAPKPNPKPNPSPKADPKAKAQMAIIFNKKKKHGDTGMSYAGEYGGYGYGQETYFDYNGDGLSQSLYYALSHGLYGDMDN